MDIELTANDIITDVPVIETPELSGSYTVANLELTSAQIDKIVIDLAANRGSPFVLDLRGNAFRTYVSYDAYLVLMDLEFIIYENVSPQTDYKDYGLNSNSIDNILIYLESSLIEFQRIDLRGNSSRTSLSDDAFNKLIDRENEIYIDVIPHFDITADDIIAGGGLKSNIISTPAIAVNVSIAISNITSDSIIVGTPALTINRPLEIGNIFTENTIVETPNIYIEISVINVNDVISGNPIVTSSIPNAANSILRYSGDIFVGNSFATKPTKVIDGARFYETDTLKTYLKVNGSWEELIGSIDTLVTEAVTEAVGPAVTEAVGNIDITTPINEAVSNIDITTPINNAVEAIDILTPINEAVVEAVGNVNYFGDLTNRTKFDAKGHMTMEGEAVIFKDELEALIKQSTNNSSAKLVQNFPEGTLDFKDTCELVDYAIVNIQINHDAKVGAKVYPHLHWFQKENKNPNWLLQYRWQINGQTKQTSWSEYALTTNAFPWSSGVRVQITTNLNGLIPPSTQKLSDILQLRLIRDAGSDGTYYAAITDTYTGNAETLSMDIHYAIDSLGSDTEFEKIVIN